MKQRHTFSEWIAYFLDNSGQSQAAIERQMGVRKGVLSKWKNDEVGSPLPENIRAFAKVLHLSADQLTTLLRLAGYQVAVDPALDSPESAAARDHYLRTMVAHYGTLRPHAFTALAKDNRVGQVRQLPLVGEDGMFVPLRFDSLSERMGRPVRRKREWLLPDILQLPGHLAIIGDAGCGKTTLLRVIATALADADNPATVAVRRGLSDPLPLPVFVPLRFFEHDCAVGKYEHTAADLLRFTDDWFGRWAHNGNLPDRFLAQHIQAGRAWLLLDALDEVADPNHRKTMRNTIEQLAESYPGTRLIVTARVAGYRGARLSDAFSLVQVCDLEDDQRRQMLRGIYHALNIENGAARAEKLADRFRNDPLAELGRTPVMVWTAGVIEALRGKLPETRAALYNEYSDMLLRHSFKENENDTAALDAIRSDERWSVEDRLDHLCYLAFEVHRRSEPSGESSKREQRPLDEGELVDDILSPRFLDWGLVDTGKKDSKRRARMLARDFLTVMVEHSGLVYEPVVGNYTIGDHLTMQEFLAGRYLVNAFRDEDADGFDTFLREKVGHSWWREVLELGVGYLADTASSRAKSFLEHLARRGDTPLAQLRTLTATVNAMLPLRHRRQLPGWYGGLASRFSGKLYSLLYAEPPDDVPVALKQRAGLGLGWLYGYPGEGTLADPRFAAPGGLPAFIKFPAGSFWMGEDDSGKERERPRHSVYLDEFELAKYPVTNAMYARFIAAGGYDNPAWWQAAIAAGRWESGAVKDWRDKRICPVYWDDVRFNNPSQPVVGVTWYEAVAYCAWLTATRADGYRYHLPTEAQWERAARGKFGLTEEPPLGRYPWGDKWQANAANSKESGLGMPSPVGLFPAGDTTAGVADMVGNVWEWCTDWFDETYYQRSPVQNPTGPETGVYRVLRGGSWYSDNPAVVCCAGYRGRSNPNYWFDYYTGFRCARTSL